MFVSRPCISCDLEVLSRFPVKLFTRVALKKIFYYMPGLWILKLEYPQRLPVGCQHYRQLMTENVFLVFFVLKTGKFYITSKLVSNA